MKEEEFDTTIDGKDCYICFKYYVEHDVEQYEYWGICGTHDWGYDIEVDSWELFDDEGGLIIDSSTKSTAPNYDATIVKAVRSAIDEYIDKHSGRMIDGWCA